MFQLWCSGDREKRICAFKKFDHMDMPTIALKKRLSDVRNLMGRLEKKLQNDNAWIVNPSLAEINIMFAHAKGVLEIPVQTKKGRKRQLDQLSWQTHLDLLRSIDKQARFDEDEGVDSE
jgi:hypothetical protein